MCVVRGAAGVVAERAHRVWRGLLIDSDLAEPLNGSSEWKDVVGVGLDGGDDGSNPHGGGDDVDVDASGARNDIPRSEKNRDFSPHLFKKKDPFLRMMMMSY